MIRTANLTLQAFRPQDRDAFARVLRDEQAMAAFGGTYTEARIEEELQHYLRHRTVYGYAPFAVWYDGELVGDIGLQRLEEGPDVELLYRLLPTVWGRGFGTEAGRANLDFAFQELDVPEVLAVISKDNVPSRVLASKLGFVSGDEGTYYGQRLVRHHVTPELAAKSHHAPC